MMQLVNFYFEEYRPKPLSFDLKFAILFVTTVIVVLIILGSVQISQLTNIMEQAAQKKQQYDQIVKQTSELQKGLANRRKAIPLEAEIQSYQKRYNQYQKAFAALNISDDEANPFKFSHVLTALTKQKIQQIWLTEIAIDPINLSLYGSSTHRDAIPDYVSNLKEHDTLNRAFDELSLKQNNTNKNIIDFSLINGRKINE